MEGEGTPAASVEASLSRSKKTVCNGADLRAMFDVATAWLERNADAINALNVFPVPDGDTGTNMSLTMRATMEEAARASADSNAGAVARSMAQGALMGARGNSGVILSQIIRGLSLALDGKDEFDGRMFAAALDEAAKAAYRSLSRPVEGTMLTVIRESAQAAQAAAKRSHAVSEVMETIVEAARVSVEHTPELLEPLRAAGVVDAGGQGLYVMFQGAAAYLKEEVPTSAPALSVSAGSPTARFDEQMVAPHGYCTEFLLEAEDLDPLSVRAKLEELGESVLVVGQERMLRAHVHTDEPGVVLSLATSLGTLRQVKVQNMADQHSEFIAKGAVHTGAGVVAVAPGSGIAEVFRSLGAVATVPGGQSMNPSTSEILRVVDSVPNEEVIVLPNNKNVVLAARQVEALAHKKVVTIPTHNAPQGVAALLAFNPDAPLAVNEDALREAVARVRAGDVTKAVRDAEIEGLHIKRGQAIGFVDGKLQVTARNPREALYEVLARLEVTSESLVTIYFGADVPKSEAARVGREVRARWPGCEVETVSGGQPHYHYIVSVE